MNSLLNNFLNWTKRSSLTKSNITEMPSQLPTFLHTSYENEHEKSICVPLSATWKHKYNRQTKLCAPLKCLSYISFSASENHVYIKIGEEFMKTTYWYVISCFNKLCHTVLLLLMSLDTLTYNNPNMALPNILYMLLIVTSFFSLKM